MDKAELYSKALKDSLREKNPAEVLAALKALLAKKNEEYLLARILKRVIAMFESEEKTVITSRYPLDTDAKKRVIELLKKNFPESVGGSARFETDEKAVGGVKIMHKDFLFDGTIKNKLDKI